MNLVAVVAEGVTRVYEDHGDGVLELAIVRRLLSAEDALHLALSLGDFLASSNGDRPRAVGTTGRELQPGAPGPPVPVTPRRRAAAYGTLSEETIRAFAEASGPLSVDEVAALLADRFTRTQVATTLVHRVRAGHLRRLARGVFRITPSGEAWLEARRGSGDGEA